MPFRWSTVVFSYNASKTLKIRKISENFINVHLVHFPGWETSRIRTGHSDSSWYHFSRTLRRSENQALHFSPVPVYILRFQGSAYHAHYAPLTFIFWEVGWCSSLSLEWSYPSPHPVGPLEVPVTEPLQISAAELISKSRLLSANNLPMIVFKSYDYGTGMWWIIPRRKRSAFSFRIDSPVISFRHWQETQLTISKGAIRPATNL